MNVVAFIPTQWQQLVGLRSASCVQKSAAPPCCARAYYSAWESCFLRSWSTQIHLHSHFPELHLQGRGAQGVAIAFGANRSISAALRTIPPCPQGQHCTPSSTPSPQRCPLDRKHILCLAARSGRLLLGEQGLRSTGTATNKLQLQLGSAATDGKTTAGISMKKKIKKSVQFFIKASRNVQVGLEGDPPNFALCLAPCWPTPDRNDGDLCSLSSGANPFSSSFPVPAHARGNYKQLTLTARAPRWD